MYFFNKITNEIKIPDWFEDGLSKVYWVKSILDFKANKIKESERFINKAIEIDNEYPPLHYILFRIKEKENKFLALNVLNIAIEKIETLYHDNNYIIEIDKYEKIFYGYFIS